MSRALTVQTTNETQSRIISAAARRATLPVIPRREQTPPLTQEERLAQALLTEEENKMSLKRIVEAEEERARKRREKLEALRRRRFDEPIIRFISRPGSLIEEIPDDEEEEEDIVIDDGKQESIGAPEIKLEGVDPMVVDEPKDTENNARRPEWRGKECRVREDGYRSAARRKSREGQHCGKHVWKRGSQGIPTSNSARIRRSRGS